MIIDFPRTVERLKMADDILILTHANPDGDTLGSGIALLCALKKMGKRVKLINGDEINKKYDYLFEGVSMPEFKERFIISVDVADRKLLGDKISEQYGDKVDLAIDHHSASKAFAKETYCEPGSASACEVIYLLIKALGVTVDKKIADCIYTGVTTDTGCFRYSNVTARTHRIAAELIAYGANAAMINTVMFETKSMNSILLEKLCLDTLELYGEGKLAVITVTKDILEKTSSKESDLDAIVPLARQIEGVKVGVTIKEKENGTVSVSVRTHEGYDASAICSHFGGGGHTRAAGCKFDEEPLKVKEDLVKYITENII